MIDRKQITSKLTELTFSYIGPVSHAASEVVLDYGHAAQRKIIDILAFKPEHQMSVDGIEKGQFTCYEIKSCYEDVYSGNGLNFIGEKNYLVTTFETYLKLKDEQDKLSQHIQSVNSESYNSIGYSVGILVPVPIGKSVLDEYDEPTPFSADGSYRLLNVQPCYQQHRKRSLIELMFCLMRAATNGR